MCEKSTRRCSPVQSLKVLVFAHDIDVASESTRLKPLSPEPMIRAREMECLFHVKFCDVCAKSFAKRLRWRAFLPFVILFPYHWSGGKGIDRGALA